MSFNLAFGDIAAIITIIGTLGAFGIGYVLLKGRSMFASAGAVAAVTSRLGHVEQQLGTTVTHSDLGEVYRRLAGVEQQQAVLVNETGHIRTGMSRVEGQLGRLIEATVAREAVTPRSPHK